jgi:hypothetical protein
MTQHGQRQHERGYILIGEKAADRITDDPDLALDEFVGKPP